MITLHNLNQQKYDLIFKIRTGLALDVLFVLLMVTGYRRVPTVLSIAMTTIFFMVTILLIRCFGRLQNCRRQISNFYNIPPPPSNRATKY